MTTITRDALARMLESEAHNTIAEHIRAGSDPRKELANWDGIGLRKALRSSRYVDSISRNAKATFEEIVRGEIEVVD